MDSKDAVNEGKLSILAGKDNILLNGKCPYAVAGTLLTKNNFLQYFTSGRGGKITLSDSDGRFRFFGGSGDGESGKKMSFRSRCACIVLFVHMTGTRFLEFLVSMPLRD